MSIAYTFYLLAANEKSIKNIVKIFSDVIEKIYAENPALHPPVQHFLYMLTTLFRRN